MHDTKNVEISSKPVGSFRYLFTLQHSFRRWPSSTYYSDHLMVHLFYAPISSCTCSCGLWPVSSSSNQWNPRKTTIHGSFPIVKDSQVHCPQSRFPAVSQAVDSRWTKRFSTFRVDSGAWSFVFLCTAYTYEIAEYRLLD